MSVSTTYNFTTPADYTYDPALIEVDAGIASLLDSGGYSTANPTITPDDTVGAEQFVSITEIVTKTGLDLVKYTISVDGTEYYWTGVAWATSSGYAQSNTAAEINTGALSLDLTGGANIRPVIYLHSDSGLTTPSVDSLIITYDFFSELPDTIDKCVVWGYIYDFEGNPVEDIDVSAQIITAVGYKTSVNFGIGKVSTTSSASGYWELDLIDTANMIPNTTKYLFSFSGNGMNVSAYKSVPNQSSAAYNSLT
jgi:hypothetical protein